MRWAQPECDLSLNSFQTLGAMHAQQVGYNEAMKRPVITRLQAAFSRLTLARRFMLASLVVIVLAALGLGYWVRTQIREGVINRAGATTALYVDSFIAPRLQELGQASTLSPQNADTIRKLLTETSFGNQILAFKVWDLDGRVVFSSDPESLDQVFPMHAALIEASRGNVSTRLSVEDAENAAQTSAHGEVLEIYSPVRLTGTNQVIAIAEYYQSVTALRREIAAAEQRSWLVVGLVMALIYLLLAGFVRNASQTIENQQGELNQQIVQLRDLLAQNRALSKRVRRAAAQVTTNHENLLRRVGADLHDGPAQDLGLALLQIDTVLVHLEQQPGAEKERAQVASIQGLLQNTLQEMRGIAGGFSLPVLQSISLPETFARVVSAHERRAAGNVTLQLEGVPDEASLPTKIAVYRIVQEALHNAQRYAGGVGLTVRAEAGGGHLRFEVRDDGPGFDGNAADRAGHLGLSGMRERVESLGGAFQVTSAPGKGAQIVVDLPLQAEGEGSE